MQSIALGQTGRSTTRLGFGCSSVMGALNRKDSLRLLESAYDAGIRHFDVAPLYGYGEAEGCLGEFLARHPGQVTVTTKYGIPAEPKDALKAFARGVARPLIKLLPGIKQRLAKAASAASSAPSTANDTPGSKASFTPAEAAVSLERSLRALRSDRIDLWLLHEATAADLHDEGLLRLLEDAVQQGKIGGFGLGSGREKISALLVERPAYCRVLQYEWSVLDAAIPAGGPFRLHHRALTEHFRQLHAALVGKPEVCRAWSEQTREDLADAEALARLMLKASLVMNPESVILFSSKHKGHIEENVRLAGEASLEAGARALHALVQADQGRLLAGSGATV